MSIDFSKIPTKPLALLKILGIAIAVIILLAIGVRLVATPFHSMLRMGGGGMLGGIGMSEPSVDSYGSNMLFARGKMIGNTAPIGMPGLSVRNIMAESPMDTAQAVGDGAENFEATDYNATIETRDLKKTCSAVSALKADKEIIFEVASESDHYCNYHFKVVKARAEGVLATLEGLDPKDLTENTHTIQRTVDDFTSEIDILKKKRDTIASTLDSATRAYDQITALATASQDAASLAKIIDSKIQTIERLTQEQLTVNAQLDRLERGKNEQMDQVEYTSFSVNIFENKYLDGEQLKDSWKMAVKEFVRDVNTIAQDLSVRLITLLLLVLQYFVYFLLLVLFAKLAWSAAKGIWKK
ncbi:MAG: hypothetical protein RL141_838 [Candidatus Parcubacteria bacterium]|jgi:hypothetical protein